MMKCKIISTNFSPNPDGDVERHEEKIELFLSETETKQHTIIKINSLILQEGTKTYGYYISEFYYNENPAREVIFEKYLHD